jgi:hypothetical protein
MSEAGTTSTAASDTAASRGAASAHGQALPSDPAALEQLINARRERLAATVDELVQRAQPREIARRGAQDAASRLRAAAYTPDGRLRVERVGAAAAAVATLIALIVWRRRKR